MTDDLQAKDQVQVAKPEELAAAREARGMSQVDISQRIKLQVKQVKALEQGEWDALPGRSFVRGALRSYGKLIDVDVSPLLESIGGFAEPTQVEGITPLDAPISRSSGLGFNGGGRGSPILWVIAGLIGVVALVLYFGSDRDRIGGGSWLRPGTEAPAAGGDAAAPQPPSAPANGTAAPAPGQGETPSGGSAPPGSSAAPVPSGSPSSSLEPSNGTAVQQASIAAPSSPSSSSPMAPASSSALPSPSATPSSPATQSSSSSPSPLMAPPPASGGGPDGAAAVGNAAAGTTGGRAGGPSDSAITGTAAARPDSAGPGAASVTENGSAAARAGTAGNPGLASRTDGAVATQEIAPLASARTSSNEAASPGTAAAEAPAVVDTKGLIRLEAGSQDSWIEVRQADGTALHNGLVKAGESIDLRGTPPYRLVLGNASHVTLTYEGKPRDLGPHMRANNIARLQLR